MLGQKAHESGLARRQMMQGVDVRAIGAAQACRSWSSAAGVDRHVPEESERLAEWLGADYEPFGAHSHCGLILGEHSYVQVAEAIKTFLEAHRL